MGLMTRFSDNLLDCILFLALFVFSQPHQTESPTAQQFHLVKAIRKTVPEGLWLLFAEVIRILLFLLPFQIYLLKWVFTLRLLHFALGCALPLPVLWFLWLSWAQWNMLRSDLIFEELCLFPWFLPMPGANILDLCLLQCTFEFILLTTRSHLLFSQIQVLQTLAHILFQGSLLQPRPMRLMSFPKTIMLPRVRSVTFFQWIFIPLIYIIKYVLISKPKFNFLILTCLF